MKGGDLSGVNRMSLLVSMVLILTLLFRATRDATFLSVVVFGIAALFLQIVRSDPLLSFPSPYFWIDLSHRLFYATLIYACLFTKDSSLSLVGSGIVLLTVFSRLFLGKCMLKNQAGVNFLLDITLLSMAAWSVLRFHASERTSSIVSPLFQMGAIAYATTYDY